MVCVTVTALIAFPAHAIAASVARVFATCVVMNIARLAAALAITLAAVVACPATFVAFPTWSVVDLPRVLSCVDWLLFMFMFAELQFFVACVCDLKYEVMRFVGVCNFFVGCCGMTLPIARRRAVRPSRDPAGMQPDPGCGSPGRIPTYMPMRAVLL